MLSQLPKRMKNGMQLGEALGEEEISAPTVSVVPEAVGSSTIKSQVSEDEESAVDMRPICLRERHRLKTLDQKCSQHFKGF